ncbi:unnamed protein product [Heterobilharzia americana]|nr:unnamed protein product [Heterobilharzia americana]
MIDSADDSMNNLLTDSTVRSRDGLTHINSTSISAIKNRVHRLKSRNLHYSSVTPEEAGDESSDNAPIKDVTCKLSSSLNQNDSEFLDTGFTLIGYTFFLQITLHIITFVLNSLSYRYLDTASLGLVNVRLGLFYSTLVFTAREAFRRACLSRGGELVNRNKWLTSKSNELSSSNVNVTTNPISEDSVNTCPPPGSYTNEHKNYQLSIHSLQWNGILNLVWLVLPTGCIMAALLFIVWIFILPSPSSLISESHSELNLTPSIIEHRYIICVMIYALSGLFELATEPFWLLCQLSHKVRTRIFIEAFANAARAVGIMSAIFTVPSQYAVYSLSIPQYTIDRPGLQLVKNFFGQCILKQLLTEGERYLISAFHLISFTDQGIYDLVNNLGSLAARLLFLPLEESCHFMFSQCLQRDVSPNHQDKKLLMDAFRMLKTALRVSSLVAWIGVTFAQANSRLLLMIYAGHRLADNPTAVNLLQLYSAYVLLLAWNGSSEALLNSAMSTDEVSRHNQRLVIFSMIFLGANWFSYLYSMYTVLY